MGNLPLFGKEETVTFEIIMEVYGLFITVKKQKMSVESAKKLLSDAGLFFWPLGKCNDHEDEQTLNMNDTWAWGTAFGQKVEDGDAIEVARLFVDYGFCGVLYWVSEKNEQMQSEFSHINRMVQFVRNEEKIRIESGGLNAYAYGKQEYLISA